MRKTPNAQMERTHQRRREEGEKDESEIRKSEEKFCVGATTSTMNPNPEEEKSINVECSADSGVTVCSAALLDDSSRGFFSLHPLVVVGVGCVFFCA